MNIRHLSYQKTILFLIISFLWSPFLKPQAVNNPQVIDSLITVKKITDKTILIKFDYDAVTAVTTTKGIVVIDAGISTELTAKYRQLIETQFPGQGFAYVIITHGHPDHYGGISIFKEATIIGHALCQAAMSAQINDSLKVQSHLLSIADQYEQELQTIKPGTTDWTEAFCQKERYLSAYLDARNHVPLLYPTLTFTDTLNLKVGELTFNVIYFGEAHSESDIVVHIPALKLLLVGDLFSNYGRPSIEDREKQDVDRWLKAISWMESRLPDIEVIVGGHGQVMTKSDLLSFCELIKKKSVKN